jgi:RES domain-containing protein
MVYTSGEPALAVLEYFVNLEIEDAPHDLVMVAADVPDSLAIAVIDPETLPRGWRATPAPATLARMGTAWAAEARTAVLSVPSAVVPVQRNYLLNAAGPGFTDVVVRRREPLSLDPRMWKRRRR